MKFNNNLFILKVLMMTEYINGYQLLQIKLPAQKLKDIALN